MLDGFLAASKFIAGERYSIADITAVVAIDFAKLIKLRITPEQKKPGAMVRSGILASKR